MACEIDVSPFELGEDFADYVIFFFGLSIHFVATNSYFTKTAFNPCSSSELQIQLYDQEIAGNFLNRIYSIAAVALIYEDYRHFIISFDTRVTQLLRSNFCTDDL